MVKPAELRSALPRSIQNPVLMESVTRGSGPFFATEELTEIRSGAVVPLFLSGKVIGTLNLGSRDPDRYTAEHGTDFLRRLGCKVSLIIDNIIAHQRLTAISVTDQLTGISNRRQFDAALGREMERAKRHATPLACVVVDLDGFKEINDRFGHQVGDEALRHVGSVLRDRSRRYDVVARYGGDEFAILLPQTDTEGAVRFAEKFRREMTERPLALGDDSTLLGLSIGVAATSEMPGCQPEDLVREADRRMYAAKKSGGNRIVSSPDS
jgi:diguanylate cyclase (GGDEF)-like protein